MVSFKIWCLIFNDNVALNHTNLPSNNCKFRKYSLLRGFKSFRLPFVSNVEENCFPIFEMTVMFTACVKHSAGRALASDWSANSFIMVVCENFWSCLGQEILTKLKKKTILLRQKSKTIYGSAGC